LLIDGDIFVYQCVTEHLQEVEVRDQEWSYVLNESDAKASMRNRIDETMQILNGKECTIAFGSIENWRKRIMPEYKANRKGKRKPLGYDAIVKWMKKEFECLSFPGLEADDVLGVLATDNDVSPHLRKIIVSEDKDFQGVPCWLWSPRHPEQEPRLITAREANEFHLTQTLTGDTTDGYYGVKGIGAVTAQKILSAHSTYADQWGAIVAAYVKSGKTERDALITARVARILRADEIDDNHQPVLWMPPTKEVKNAKDRKKA
jgi:DNA polymerase-1